MTKVITLMFASIVTSLGFSVTLSDAQVVLVHGQPGLVGASFSGSTSLNTSSLPNQGTQLGVFTLPSAIYDTSGAVPEQTTYSYSGYMWMKGGQRYTFKGNYDDFTGVKVANGWLYSGSGERNGSYTPAQDGWYVVDFRVGNNGGPGGLYSSGQYGILWKTDSDAEWHKVQDPGNGSMFCTDQLPGLPPPVISVNPKIWNSRTLTVDVSFASQKTDCRLFACHSSMEQGPDTNAWACIDKGEVLASDVKKTVSFSVPQESNFVRICAVTEAGVSWSKTFALATIEQPAFSVREFNAAGSTEASFMVDVDSLGANAESATVSVKYGQSKDELTMTKELGTISEPEVVSNVVSGLEMDRKYWYRIEVENSNAVQCQSDVSWLEIVRQWPYSVSATGELTITGLPAGYESNCRVPSLIEGHPVTAMYSGGCKTFGGPSKMIIPSSVRSFTNGDFSLFAYTGMTIEWYTSPEPMTVSASAFDNLRGSIIVYAYGECPAGFPVSWVTKLYCMRSCAGSWLKEVGYNVFQGYLDSDDPDDVLPLSVQVTSTKMRENDPTIMDVEYIVNSKKPRVKTRVLAYQDGTKSFAKVLRPETFTAETRAFVGDNVTANETHPISWHVAADWGTDLSRVAFEVLAIEEDLLPLEVTTIPATANHAACTYSWNAMTADQVLAALYWLYADGDTGLTVQNGYLKAGGVTLASGNALSNQEKAIEYVYGKMGYSLLKGDDLTYVNTVSGLNLAPSGVRQYAIKYE